VTPSRPPRAHATARSLCTTLGHSIPDAQSPRRWYASKGGRPTSGRISRREGTAILVNVQPAPHSNARVRGSIIDASNDRPTANPGPITPPERFLGIQEAVLIGIEDGRPNVPPIGRFPFIERAVRNPRRARPHPRVRR